MVFDVVLLQGLGQSGAERRRARCRGRLRRPGGRLGVRARGGGGGVGPDHGPRRRGDGPGLGTGFFVFL